jgi:hypothetical protein
MECRRSDVTRIFWLTFSPASSQTRNDDGRSHIKQPVHGAGIIGHFARLPNETPCYTRQPVRL